MPAHHHRDLGAMSAAIARHYVAAEVWRGAARYSRLAGAEAVAQPAYREALPCLEQALATGAHLGKEREAAEHTIDTRCDLYRALLPSGRPERLLGVLREAEAEATSLGDRTRLGWITAYTANCLWLSGLHAVAAEAAGRALEIAAAPDDPH